MRSARAGAQAHAATLSVGKRRQPSLASLRPQALAGIGAPESAAGSVFSTPVRGGGGRGEPPRHAEHAHH